MVRSILVVLFLCVVSPVWGQSWCTNAPLNPTEQTICATPDLGWRDAQMVQAYDAVRHLPGLPAQQQGWLAQRNACGWNAGCIGAAYDRRIAALQGLVTGGGKPHAPMGPLHPTGPAWCADGALNPTEQTICASPELGQMDRYMGDLYNQVRSYPGVATDQRNWLAARNACRADHTCIRAAYESRISGLQSRYGIN
ncbi:lysozyme inhibitor LprI family protein [Nioella nitratireducens]|uniref:lysozyme inhibitor LprI family protein n=1 Tax=Nioella nitratireducens TaxID=1287720 RepID=UPI0008FD808F|nr:lysozyme inhibitor LprI family protein [Nioella nitratireducens]